MNNLKTTNSIFENIKHIDENGLEYWNARELQKTLGYKEWRKFNNIIEKAKVSCMNSNSNIYDHFVQSDKMITIAKGGKRNIIDYKLSRYACYLIAQNGDSHIKNISLAQTYFAIQTRKQELLETNIDELTEIEKRKYQRNLTKKANLSLNKTTDVAVRNFIKKQGSTLPENLPTPNKSLKELENKKES